MMALACFTESRSWNGENIEDDSTPEVRMIMDILPTRPARIVLMGHSFLTRLGDYMHNNLGRFNNFGMEHYQAQIYNIAVGGRTAQKCRNLDLGTMTKYLPDIVYLEIGTNDLSPKEAKCEVVSAQIHELCNDILGLGPKLVVVGQIIKRTQRGIPRRNNSFNDKVITTNKITKALLGPEMSPGTRFWTHRGFWFSDKDLIDGRGVHLTTLGNRKLYRSVRGALLQAVRYVRPAIN
jgi:hypothetical protein